MCGELGRIAVDFSSRREEDSRPLRWKHFSGAARVGLAVPRRMRETRVDSCCRLYQHTSTGHVMLGTQPEDWTHTHTHTNLNVHVHHVAAAA